MSGYLDGSLPDQTDIQRILEHLQGQTLLTDENYNRADLNGDGEVDIIDLSLMRQAVHSGLNLPIPPLQISAPQIKFIRPGGEFEIEVFGIYNTNNLNIVLVTHHQSFPIELLESTPVTDDLNELVLTVLRLGVPRQLAQTNDNELFVDLRLSNGHSLSNTISIPLIDAPRIDSIERIDANSDAAIRISGEGFGSSSIVIRFGSLDVDSVPINETTIEVHLPTNTVQHTGIFVIVGDRRSNPGFFSRLTTVDIQIELPNSSPLALNDLSIFASDGRKIPVSASGTTRVESEYRELGSFEVVDPLNRVVLQAHSFGENSLTINTLSTAISLVFESLQASKDQLSTPRLLITQTLANSTEVASLQNAISMAHSQTPTLEVQFESIHAVREAMTNAVISMRSRQLGRGG